jgi:hypothetical protein
MKNLVQLALLLTVVAGISACGSGEKGNKPKYPLFWTWMDYRPGSNFDSICAVASSTGIDGIMLNAPTPNDYRVAIPIAHKYGIEIYAWLWTMNLEHGRDSIVAAHPDWQSVNRKGESLADHTAYVDYYKFMSPAIPEVRQYIKDKVKAYCEVDGLNGIAIDYHRMVDVILPTTLWPVYGIVQDKEYPEWDYGYDPAMLKKFNELYGYDPREQDDPSTDAKWLQFRCDQITEVANEIAEVVHSFGKTMAASPFPTPEMSRSMVRQDWGKWNLDIVFPMAYHDFYTGDVSFIADCTIENVKSKNPMTTLGCGMTVTNGPRMFDCMDAALNNGAEAVAIFTVGGLATPEIRAQFKAYTDSVRAQRSRSTVNPAATGTTAVVLDPFQKTAIMEAINMRISAYIGLAKSAATPELKDTAWATIEKVSYNAFRTNTATDFVAQLKSQNRRRRQAPQELKPNPVAEALAANPFAEIALSDYSLADHYGTTKCYTVTEKNSGVLFNVNFYFYGGIISGWSVAPEQKSYDKYRKSL